MVPPRMNRTCGTRGQQTSSRVSRLAAFGIGAQWTKTASGLTATVGDIALTADGTVFLLGQYTNGEVMRRRPGETSFSHIDYRPDGGLNPILVSIWASGPNDLWAAADTRDGTIWALFIDPHHEGRGIGRALFKAACDVLRQTGHRTAPRFCKSAR